MAAKKIDINKAELEDFETLCGIGHAKAEAILEARQTNGGFRSVSDLLEIQGIGPGLLEQNRGLIVCSRIPQSRKLDRNKTSDKKSSENPASSSSCVAAGPSQTKSPTTASGTKTEAASSAKTSDKPEPATSETPDKPKPRSSHHFLRSDTKDGRPLCASDSDSDIGGEFPGDVLTDGTFSSTPSSVMSPQEDRMDTERADHDLTTPTHSDDDDDDDDRDTDVTDAGHSTDTSTRPPDKGWQMKRKSDGEGSTDTCMGKKPCRLRSKSSQSEYPEYDSSASLRDCLAALSACNNASAIRKQRIPSKSNPPPQLAEWLKTFQEWSHAERLLALDEMIEFCEPTQVRHLMGVIEPQFQRDFISLLPKELALYVLSFLEPRALLQAAQTCRYWRVLAEDNLLWREKCREEAIDEAAVFENNRVHLRRKDNARNPYKNLYLRQKAIEHNWRATPIRPPKVLKGHDDHVITCLEFSGTKIVSGSDDNTLKVWSSVSGKCLRTLVGHTGGVWSSQMAGNVIISGSTDRTLKVWNAETGQCTYTLYGHTSTVRCMHLNGNKVVSGSRDATLRVWDVDTGQCLHVLMGHMAAVRCVQYDGKRVVSGAYDYTVRVWDPETESCVHILNGHTNRVYSLQFDGVHIVSGSLDTSIRVWDVEHGTCLHTLIGHQSLTSGMELKDNILVSGNADSTVKVWDITTGQCLQTLQGTNKHQSAVTCLQFNKKFVITSSDDGSVKIWDLRAGDFLRNLVSLDSGGSGGVVWRIRCSNTKLVCAVGSRNGTEETKLLVLDFDVLEDSTTHREICSTDC